MHLLVIAMGRLISNGSAGNAVMCGLVQAALERGWSVSYLALCPEGEEPDWEQSFDFGASEYRLRRQELNFHAKPCNRYRRFLGGFNLAAVSEMDNLSQCSSYSDVYDAAIAFDSLPISLIHQISATKKIVILGDPAGKRLWHSTPWRKPLNKLKAGLLGITEILYFRGLSVNEQVAMFGSGHAKMWSRHLTRRVLDLRPFLPVTEFYDKVQDNEKPIIYFGGTLAGTASKQSITIIFDGIIPALREKFGKNNVELRLIGKCPESFLLKARQYREISVLGRVDSFEEELQKGDIFILPMNYPVGVRTRVCAALGAGNICIVHPSVFYNMPELRACPAVWQADSAADYASLIARMPSRENLVALRKKARAFFEEHYSAINASASLLNLLAK
ncbi:glycosyltransferase [Paludibacterium purpuratum]|uniref:Glycosyl transferase family 1 n=1 Tax=Paludibacterium purpuratum TaxID=1144873 RepID=A0A4R7B3X7_9NEIS|nr:glycosyltransferase [Paludibacterium purpuratum]TDR76730.1 glycosyl transferase family 1 [Paludibacterium purpuratum]